MYCFCFFSQFYGGSIGQPIYMCWGTNENWTEFPIAWKSHLFLQFLGNHIPLRLPPRMIRYGKIWVEEVDFFRNNETLKIDGGPFVTEPIVTSYNVPSQGSEKCTMGERRWKGAGWKKYFRRTKQAILWVSSFFVHRILSKKTIYQIPSKPPWKTILKFCTCLGSLHCG